MQWLMLLKEKARDETCEQFNALVARRNMDILLQTIHGNFATAVRNRAILLNSVLLAPIIVRLMLIRLL